MLHQGLSGTRLMRFLVLWMSALFGLAAGLAPSAQAAGDPAQGPGGPILVVTSGSSTYGKYYAEILRTEGLNAFTVADISTVTASSLAAYDVVVLAKMPITSAQATIFTNWVSGGGNLIAMAPDLRLASLLGITSANASLSNGYLQVDTGQSPGNGIVSQTLQFHGSADLYTLNGASKLATMYSTSTSSMVNPAVTIRTVSSGKAAMFAFDLATSVVYTRQGNPAWANQERDGLPPIRSDDKFFGNTAGDTQPDWIDLDRVAIPQADEQQRLLANLILFMNGNKKPLPRFWYFPNGKKAVVVMTGDDHGNGGTMGRFDQFKAQSAPGCSLANWECIRGTSYMYTTGPMTDAQAAQYTTEGFEVGLHINTGCSDYDLPSLQSIYSQQVGDFTFKYPSAGALATQRHHCIVWSDWVSGAQVQLANGMRLDTSYYYWPPSWVGNVPGHFNGSAMPMRFTKLDGSFLDVYQAATQMTDESGQTYPFTIDTLLDRAVGAEGQYGVYTVNAHTDVDASSVADAVVASAKARGVPVVSAKQMLGWLDARNASSFGAIGYTSGVLSFSITKDPAANGLKAMLPARFGNRQLGSLTRSGSAVTFTTSTIKGIDYVFFDAVAGSYLASYAADAAGPTVSSKTPAAGATGVSVTPAITVTFSEAMTASSITNTSIELRDAANTLIATSVSYDAGSRTATISPVAALTGSAVYTVTVRGGATDPRVKDAAGNAMSANVSWSFTTGTAPPPPTCPCSGFDSLSVPTTLQADDPSAVELGVKFKSDVAGSITGIRFYKGPGNTGTHIGNLWNTSGTLLASATFTGETASGWQQVNFSAPVAILPNVVYVASYFAPVGAYSANSGYFLTTGLDNGPLHFLKDGVNGGNGVYQYSAQSTYPLSSYNGTNYWVDVVFSTTVPADTTAPTVTSVTPAAGTTGVGTATTATVTFSEAMSPATIGTSSIELRNAANTLIATTVSYDAPTKTATITPTATLAASTTYTVTVKGGSVDPRVKDLAGNALAVNKVWSFTTGTAAGGCGAPANAIVAENCLTGNAPSEWDVSGVGDASIQGYATDIAVNAGGTVFFKVDTNATAYRFDIYRMGYYGGLGARKVATVLPTASLPQTQPACLSDPVTGLVDCGNWAVSGSWAVPAGAVSGIYFAKLTRTDTGGSSHIVFVVRNDASHSKILFQTSDTTWQAYNDYAGQSLYTGSPAGRAYKVSYNRPFFTRGVANGQDWVFNSEYPMVRWLESNGYDVSYMSGVDVDRIGSLILNHSLFMSVGHDEYWSAGQRANVTTARNAGVHLAFFSGNEIFWKTRWEPSIDGSNTAYRTLVSYKETHANAKIDPTAAWTGTWRDPRFSPPADGNRPENELTGTLFMVNDGATTAITVPSADGKMRFWRNTTVATLGAGATATMPTGTLGYEWDIDMDNGSRPAGLFRLSTTTVANAPLLQDYGSNYASGTAVHSLTLYKHSSGARVFGAGTVQWAWGLDSTHDRSGTPADTRMQQATVNLLADMGVQPGSLKAGLIAGTASTDTVAPSSAITVPASGSNAPPGSPVTISGTASDAGGGVVAGVEVSADGGATWHPASGRGTWTYSWLPTGTGAFNIKSRAVDDSGNLETPSAGITVNVAPQTCPCTIFSSASTPVTAADGDSGAVNVGVKFTTDVAGTITGIRFYKGAGNGGTHIGALWSSTGTLLASATFTGETSTGWQQVNFATPVTVAAGTTYVASYFAPLGHYAADANFFASAGVNNPPMHAASGANGVYVYAGGNAFPTASYQSTNYWVDAVFSPSGPDTTPPAVSAKTPAAGATGVSIGSAVTVTFNEPMDAATITGSSIELRNAANALVPASVSYDAASRKATLQPSAALAASTVHTATVKGGTVDPRVKDVAGNAMAANVSWSFTTGAAPTCPCSAWAASATPAQPSVNDSGAVNVGVKFRSDLAGFITGIRFYKGTGNTGTHVANLWTTGGTLLATANFSGETATGWQQVNFASPVAITANTVYVASYFAPLGHYAGDNGFFATTGVDNGPIHLLQDGVSGGNGVYVYGSASAFPSSTWQSSNYWVDVVFTP